MDNPYILSMREHLAELQSELQGLTDIISQRDLNRYEYRAAERTLQILTEACIHKNMTWHQPAGQRQITIYNEAEKCTQLNLKQKSPTNTLN